MQAFTEIGPGNITSVQQTTAEEAPSGPPRNVTVTQSGPKSISLSWLPPKFPNGLINYVIDVFDKGN